MPDSIEAILAAAAARAGEKYAGPLGGELLSAAVLLGTQELERRLGARLEGASPEAKLALLDQIQIGDTDSELAEGGRLAGVRNPQAAEDQHG